MNTTHRFTGVRLLTDNDKAWQAKRHLIANAADTLDLCYFILEFDGSTSRLMLDLIEAAERGVKVRLLVDYFMTFEQVAALRALAGGGNIKVRRYGLPRPAWLGALKEAGIDQDAFVKALMAANGPKLAEALKGNTIFAPSLADDVSRLRADPGENPINFPMQVCAALPTVADAAFLSLPLPTAPITTLDRAAALRKVALVIAIAIAIVRGLKHFLRRTHHKLVLADDHWFIMEGRNLADAYQCTQPSQGRAFQDTELLACDGRAGGSDHRITFEALWGSAESADIAQADALDARPAAPLAAFQERAQPAAAIEPGAAFARRLALPDMDGRLVDNLPSAKGDVSITRAYVEQIEQWLESGATGTVDIVSAYVFLVDNAAESDALLTLRDAFLAAARAGHAVNIYTNSIQSTDLQPVNQAAYPKLIDLIDAGVDIHELDEGQGSLHTKCAAIGEACLIVGSYNLDPRSELYDTNNLIVLHEPSGAATAAFRKARIEGLKWTRLTADAARQLAETRRSPAASLMQGAL